MIDPIYTIVIPSAPSWLVPSSIMIDSIYTFTIMIRSHLVLINITICTPAIIIGPHLHLFMIDPIYTIIIHSRYHQAQSSPPWWYDPQSSLPQHVAMSQLACDDVNPCGGHAMCKVSMMRSVLVDCIAIHYTWCQSVDHDRSNLTS